MNQEKPPPIHINAEFGNEAEKELLMQDFTETVNDPNGGDVSMTLKAKPEAQRCDFCGEPQPPWDYPAVDFTSMVAFRTHEGREIVERMVSIGDWGACDTCHDLIEADRIDDLRTRMTLAHGLESDPVIKSLVFSQLSGFFKHRTGPSVPCPPGSLGQ